jgi:DNA-binding protein H-NS
MALKTMSVAKLQDLKSQVEAAISAKVSERRQELESELSKLDGYSGGARRGRPAGRGGPRGSVAPKYRNPENPAETWAGPGVRKGKGGDFSPPPSCGGVRALLKLDYRFANFLFLAWSLLNCRVTAI